MHTVAIAGVGLIGGSFGLALRQAGFQGRILGVSSPATIATAVERGAIDQGATLEDAAARADVVLLATPISVILEQLGAVDAHASPGALITDAGSTKAHIAARARTSVLRARFLGGHPMAGKELSGVAHAEAGLFRGRPWAICAAREDLSPVEGEFVGWVEAIGARPVFLTAEEHDRAVAFSSHLPQLVSAALTVALAREERARDLAGPGLADMTRLADSPYSLWRDIIATNEERIAEAVDVFLSEMGRLRKNLSQHDLSAMFQTAKSVRSTLRTR